MFAYKNESSNLQRLTENSSLIYALKTVLEIYLGFSSRQKESIALKRHAFFFARKQRRHSVLVTS